MHLFQLERYPHYSNMCNYLRILSPSCIYRLIIFKPAFHGAFLDYKNEINSIVHQISQMYYAHIDRALISSLYTTGIRVALINHLCNAQRRTHAAHLTTCAV